MCKVIQEKRYTDGGRLAMGSSRTSCTHLKVKAQLKTPFTDIFTDGF